MLVAEPVIEPPKSTVGRAEYESECREALSPHLDTIISRAVESGWDRATVTYSLMYLAAKAAKK